jgi:hypothetical protein
LPINGDRHGRRRRRLCAAARPCVARRAPVEVSKS